MKPLGIAIWFTGAVRLYKDGSTFSPLFRWWHPVTWILYIVLTPVCGIIGEQITNVLPVSLSEFWRKNQDQLQWVTPFTRLDTLKPFRQTKQ